MQKLHKHFTVVAICILVGTNAITHTTEKLIDLAFDALKRPQVVASSNDDSRFSDGGYTDQAGDNGGYIDTKGPKTTNSTYGSGSADTTYGYGSADIYPNK
jgi:hypothetical protein